jgi:hypothetical protein
VADTKITDLASLTAASGDELPVNRAGSDGKITLPLTVAAGGTGQTTAAEALGELTQALTEDTAPDYLLDFVPAYDASADTGKKLVAHRAAGGSVVLASGTIAAAATLDFALDTWSGSFKVFRIFLSGVRSDSDGDVLFILFSGDGGSTFEADAADYAYIMHGCQVTGTTESITALGDDSDAQIYVGQDNFGNAANELSSVELTIFDPAATQRTFVHYVTGYWDNDATSAWNVDIASGCALAATASTDIRFDWTTGSFATSGRYTLVGYY